MNYQYLGSPQKAFIQRYCPPSMTAKQLEDIHNFKQEGDESLYQAWEWYNDLLYKCPTHDINSHQKVNIFYKGLSTMNRQLLDSQGPIPWMRPAQALTTIQTMADHSQKWHDGTTSRNIRSSSSKDGLAALDCPLNEEVKQVEEVRYGEFGRTTPFNKYNGGKFHVGPPGYYAKTDNRPPYGERRQSLEELLANHQEEYARRSTEMEVWIKKLQENVKINTRNQNTSLRNLETQIEQLTKELHSRKEKSEHTKDKEITELGSEYYNPPKVHTKTFEVTKYKFNNECSSICVSGENNETLSLGRKYGSRFRKLIMEEMEEVLRDDKEESDDET
ncbi:hypothetical protein Tco_0154525 [Tanacetum coccineum]